MSADLFLSEGGRVRAELAAAYTHDRQERVSGACL